jgi:hypothetical protein
MMRAASRRAGNTPTEGPVSHSCSSSGRHSSASARPSALRTAARGNRSASAIRARTGAPASARGEPSASERASVAKVSASPSCKVLSTRRPRARFSWPGGNAVASSSTAAVASACDSHPISSTSPAFSAARALASSASGARPSSGVGCRLSTALASAVIPCRQTARRSSALVSS